MPLKNKHNDIARKYLSILKSNKSLEGMVIFGDFFDQEIIKNSDIDILAVFGNEENNVKKNLILRDRDFKINIHIHSSTLKELEYEIKENVNRIMYQNKLNGQIVFDKNGFLKNTLEELEKKRKSNINVALLKEFGKLINNFNNSKKFLQYGKFYDAFTFAIRSMNNWANLVLIENKILISKDLWENVKRYNIGVYKLYEELLSSSEPIEDKIKLIHLVFENTITIKLNKYAKLLVDTIKNNKTISYDEILNHKSIKDFGLDKYLEPVIKEYAGRNVFKETIKEAQLGNDVMVEEIYYCIK